MIIDDSFFVNKVLPAVGQVEKWRRSLTGLLQQLEQASLSDWEDEKFLTDFWASSAVSDVKLGNLPVDAALSKQRFREWFSAQARQVRALSGPEQIVVLKALRNGLIERFQDLGMKRIPRLKINRVLAALAPTRLTTLANPGTHESMYRWVTGKSFNGVHPIDQQVAIRQAFDRFAQDAGLTDPDGLTVFMLPWIAHEKMKDMKKQTKPVSVQLPQPAGENKPAAPSRSFIAVGHGLGRLLEICELVSEAPLSDEDMYESLQDRYKWNANWSKAVALFLANSLGILVREDGTFQLSSLGQVLLENRTGDVLAERLVYNFVGVDHVLTVLSEGAKSRSELVKLLRGVSPHLTTDFGPTTTLNWLAALGAIKLSRGQYSLTDAGREWARLVSWTPDQSVAPAEVLPEEAELTAIEMEIPRWDRVYGKFTASASEDGLVFPETTVFDMHTGLWSQEVRHFCILKGLSGAGKTQVAVRYARAVIAAADEDESCLEIIPVQPDWSDPSHLLGFAHPIHQGRYQGTQFLKILLNAHANPTKPHFAILDEMNLAHPELYLAPILSAMETESELWLHQSAEVLQHGIPGTIRYPRNLAIIGTINIDETTHNLSDKVKDRAEIVDFSDIRLADFKWESHAKLGEAIVVMRDVLTSLHEALRPVRLHFGFRVVSAIVERVSFAIRVRGTSDGWMASFDDAIASKILPKFRGQDSKELRLAMDAVWTSLSGRQLLRSAEHVEILRQELIRDGILNYWR
jgi:5-methylcytosine-specific restriction protein B